MPPPNIHSWCPHPGSGSPQDSSRSRQPGGSAMHNGIMEANKSDLWVLVNAPKLFKDFKAGYHGHATCSQILAITKLLNKVVLAEGNEDSLRPAT